MTARSSDQDSVRVEQADLWVEGELQGRTVVALRLKHGRHPEDALTLEGWAPVEPKAVVGQAHPHHLRFIYAVRPHQGDRPASRPERRDPDLVVAPGEAAVPYQRVAAYAVVRSDRGLLVSQFSHLTNAPGEWGLCGGGLDPGELPDEGVLREVWEESGQDVRLTGLRTISSSHWVGRAPTGRLEDFQAVRIIYDATCASPTDPVVHDIGGTTERSAWVTPAELSDLPLTPGWRALLGPGGLDPLG